eukprot:gene25026-31435_t
MCFCPPLPLVTPEDTHSSWPRGISTYPQLGRRTHRSKTSSFHGKESIIALITEELGEHTMLSAIQFDVPVLHMPSSSSTSDTAYSSSAPSAKKYMTYEDEQNEEVERQMAQAMAATQLKMVDLEAGKSFGSSCDSYVASRLYSVYPSCASDLETLCLHSEEYTRTSSTSLGATSCLIGNESKVSSTCRESLMNAFGSNETATACNADGKRSCPSSTSLMATMQCLQDVQSNNITSALESSCQWAVDRYITCYNDTVDSSKPFCWPALSATTGGDKDGGEEPVDRPEREYESNTESLQKAVNPVVVLLILVVLSLWITVQCSRSNSGGADDFSRRGPSLSAGLSHGRDLVRELYYEMTDVFRQLVGFNNMRSRRNWSFAGVQYHPAAVDDESGANTVEMINTDKNRFPASSPWSSVINGDDDCDEDSEDEGSFLRNDIENPRLRTGEKMRRVDE